ncbi:MAG: aminopeptidase P family N-terminal domain-containing protein, partial [Planctomycetota bacterium]
MSHSKRRQRLRKMLKDSDAFLITNESNVRYLTGFTG